MNKSSESDKLDALLGVHYELQALAETDVTVKTWFSMVRAGKCTVEQAMIGIITASVKEKRSFYAQITKLKFEKGEK